ncbi:sigma-70 family RNA polymerase sigma factor [Myxococcota bacterium]|nr:sigma-70 family RNA polymerase sigma factor [Myxococcota bacterium]MBU1430510.1 sigma-70 family RNA polymerase sigma factor [Myxococcota bacterium]MBU1897206.1 sigma-70 family RNA polymerase sigma factor [Myxococcota bacterium]
MHISQEREAQLLAEAKAGSGRAFRALVEPYREQIYWRAARAVGDLDEAEDVAQETLLRAFTRLETYRGEARFSAWLYQVGANCIRMHLRSRKRRRLSALEEAPEILPPEATLLQGRLSSGEPDQAAMALQLTEAIEEAIEALPPKYKDILNFWVLDGLDLRQIQARSGLSISAIKSRLHRARLQVRDILDGRGVGALLPT